MHFLIGLFVVFLIVALIDKLGGWKSIFRFVGVMIGIIVFLSVVIWGCIEYNSYNTQLDQAAHCKAVFNREYSPNDTETCPINKNKIEEYNSRQQEAQAEAARKQKELELRIKNAIVDIRNSIVIDKSSSELSTVSDMWQSHEKLVLHVTNNSRYDLAPPMAFTVYVYQNNSVVFSKDVWVNESIPHGETRYITIDIPEYSWGVNEQFKSNNLMAGWIVKVANALDFSKPLVTAIPGYIPPAPPVDAPIAPYYRKN